MLAADGAQKDSLDAWQADYAGLHTAADMDRAIRRRFQVDGTEVSAYLYAYVEEALGSGPDSQDEVRRVRDEEAKLGEQGSLALVGRRWRARIL